MKILQMIMPRKVERCVCVVGIIVFLCGVAAAKVFYNVTCGFDLMQVTLNLSNHPASIVYLQNLKGYPGCEPHMKDGVAVFRFNLNSTGTQCGLSKMLNKRTGHSTFYQRVVIEMSSPKKEKELLFAQCVIPGDFNMEFVRQDWLRESVPYNFTSPTSSSVSPETEIVPYVNLVIRDRGVRLDNNRKVRPGSLLDLLIYLDKDSSAHYDLSLRYLTLADATRSQEEIMVMNGCSVDPFVLEVFPADGGVIRSQFRAFKFQSSDVVLFLATVSVCLQQCVETDCYGDPDGSGRRKREIPRFLPHYSNEAYEVELNALVRIEDIEGDITFEESTNDTLDMYETDYSGDFSEFVAGGLTANTHSLLCDFTHTVPILTVSITLLIMRNLQS